MTYGEVAMRYEIGVDRIMWGADYPHHEGTWPHTLLALRLLFSELPEQEVRQMTSENAAEVYGFDLATLQTDCRCNRLECARGGDAGFTQ